MYKCEYIESRSRCRRGICSRLSFQSGFGIQGSQSFYDLPHFDFADTKAEFCSTGQISTGSADFRFQWWSGEEFCFGHEQIVNPVEDFRRTRILLVADQNSKRGRRLEIWYQNADFRFADFRWALSNLKSEQRFAI